MLAARDIPVNGPRLLVEFLRLERDYFNHRRIKLSPHKIYDSPSTKLLIVLLLVNASLTSSYREANFVVVHRNPKNDLSPKTGDIKLFVFVQYIVPRMMCSFRI